MCLLLELLQLFVVGRHARSGDVGINLLASSLAFLVGFRWIPPQLPLQALARLSALAAFALLGITFILGQHSVGLSNWQDDFPLLLGNEASLDRPWQGSISGVSIFGRALDLEQSQALLRSPLASESGLELRQTMQAVAIYRLPDQQAEHIVDRSLVSPPLHLDALPGQNWAYQSSRQTGKLTLAAAHAAEFSIELTCQANHLRQTGPARLLTYSLDPLQRNLSVGQELDSLVFRVRSPAAGKNGRRCEARWPNIFTDSSKQHLLVTYQMGQMRLFKNGQPAGVLRQQAWGWAGLGHRHLGWSTTLLFFPCGLFAFMAWPSRRRLKRWFLEGLSAGTIVGLTMAWGSYQLQTNFHFAIPILAAIGVPLADLMVERLQRMSPPSI